MALPDLSILFGAARSAIGRRVSESRHSKGFVIIWCTLMMTVMMGCAGIAVDVGNWYFHAQREQRGADAAALGGSVYLPGDSTSANTVAKNILTQNQLSSDNAQVTQLPDHPTQIKVVVTEDVQSYFLQILGIQHLSITRYAVAEYRPYVPMGSPSNLLGVEPNPSDSWGKAADKGLQAHYWLNISAAGTAKSNGDRYSGGICDSSTDGCNTSVTAPYGNADYNPSGQSFVIRVAGGAIGTLEVQAFDPEFANVGDTCTGVNMVTSNITYVAGVTAGMYTAGNDNPYCTGDNMTDTTKTPPPTTFSMYTPTTTPGGSTLINAGTCQAKTFPGYNTPVIPMLTTGLPTYNAAFAASFRKWVPVCDISLGSASYPTGDYILRVSNSTSTAYNGLNRYGLRAAILNGSTVNAAMTQKVAMFSQGRLVVYAHDTTGDVTFFIAQVHSGAAGEKLNVQLFDIGDATGGANLSFLPPTDAMTGGAAMPQFTGCSYTPPGTLVYQPTSTNCSIYNMGSAYNGRNVNIQVSLPGNYTCNDASTDGCWTRLKLHYGAGSVSDTTSWEVTLDGNPVRLLANSSGS